MVVVASFTAHSQCLPISTATYYPLSSNGVENTGVDAQGTYSPSGEFSAAVWDGDRPGIGTYFQGAVPDGPYSVSIAGSRQGLTVLDPDVVIVPEITNAVLVVYQGISSNGNSNIYYEVWPRTGPGSGSLGPAPIAGPLTVSSAPSGRERHPNVDIDANGIAGIVWEDYGTTGGIKVRFIDMLAGSPYVSFGSLSNFQAGSTIGLVSQPDIAMVDNAYYGTNKVHLVYKEINGASESIAILLYDFTLLSTGTSLPTPTYISSIVVNPNTLNRPRIAGGYLHEDDHIITYERYDAGSMSYLIMEDGYEAGARIPGKPSVENTNLTEIQGRPVVSYSGDLAMIMWEYDDRNTGIYSSTDEIHGQINLWNLGNWFPCLSLLEFPNTTSTRIPSICGRASHVYHVWYDAVNSQIGFKFHSSSSPNIRKQNPAISTENSNESTQKELVVYPIPSSGVLNVVNAQPGVDYQLINVQGKLVQDGKFTSPAHILRLDELPSGVYWLKLVDNQKPRTLRVVKH